MDYVWPTIAVTSLLLLLAAGWIMTLLSLPGTWLMVVGTAIYAYFVPEGWRVDVGWGVLLAVLVLAILGEVVESAAVALGANAPGAANVRHCLHFAVHSVAAWQADLWVLRSFHR